MAKRMKSKGGFVTTVTGKDSKSGSDSQDTDEDDNITAGTESESESSVDSQMEVQVEFEARNIVENDFHGIQRLLRQLFLKADIDLSGLTDLIISQSCHYGSTIKITNNPKGEEDEADGEGEGNDDDGKGEEVEDDSKEEENEVYGVTTLVHLTNNQSWGCVKQLIEHLIFQCKAHSISLLHQLSGLLEDSERPIGLLINERFLNIPLKIGPMLLRCLLKELDAASPSVGPCELVIVVGRSHSILTAPAGQKRKSNVKVALQQEQQIFDYQENEFLLKECLLSFSYPVSDECDDVFGGKWSLNDTSMKPYRTVMIVPYSRLEHAITAIENAYHNNY